MDRMAPLCMALFLLCVLRVGARPNFVIIMADDLGYNDLGYTGNPDIQTPNLDKLAGQSVRFEQFYSHPTCAPTRASLLTGRNFMKTGVWGVHGARDYLSRDETTFADVLRWSGYKTGMFGKWHNGKTDGYHPWDRGFQEACKTDLYDYFDNSATCNGKSRWAPGWTIQRITDWSIDFIDRHANHQEFLLYIPLMTPHLGKTWYGETEFWHAPEANVDKYRQIGFSEGTARLYGMIDFMDWNMGRIFDRLDQLEIADNTVVMFFSDNGPIGKELVPAWEWERRNPDMLHGNKGEVWENGIRSPLYVRWSGRFEPATVKRGIVQVEDIFPTLMELAETQGGDKPLDGKSLAPLLFNPTEVSNEWRWRTIYRTIESPEWTRAGGIYELLPDWSTDKSGLKFGFEGRWAIRQGRWKYLNINGGQLLYDIWNDPSEKTPVWDWQKIGELDAWIQKWWDGILESPLSFSVNPFYIGWRFDSMIFMMGTVEKSNDIEVRSHNVQGFVKKGSFLKYKLVVLKAAKYTVKITKWGAWKGDAEVNVNCGGVWSSTSGFVEGDVIGQINLQTAGNSCWMEFRIQSGTGFFAADILRFQEILTN
ncbi:hypothetical protein BSKO_05120 [Bryopsis sp. KO-2023]|nr:hypothetical protein BSKO_05120 [Bryopsis sp. KO-2023]